MVKKQVCFFCILLVILLAHPVFSLIIGSDESGGFFNGTIDEFKIYEYVVPESEALIHYYSGLQRIDSDAWVFYSNQSGLDEGFYVYNAEVKDEMSNSRATGLSTLVVDLTAPVISLSGPESYSGSSNNLTVDFLVSDTSYVNCSLVVNEITNQTASNVQKGVSSSFVVENLDASMYNWSVSCVDILSQQSFSENRSFFVLNMSEFEGTNLTSINFSNVSYFFIKNPEFGVINFSESVDLTSLPDINQYANISFNRIELNVSKIPLLNISAVLTLYNLSFSNPQILKDGVVCSDCTKLSYSNNSLKFNVSSFSVFSARETPIPEDDDEESQTQGGGSSGGGGGSGDEPDDTVEPEVVFPVTIEPDYFNVDSVIKIIKYGNLTLENTKDSKVRVEIDKKSVPDFLKFKHTVFNLLPNEKRVIAFDILSPKTPGVYTATLSFVSDNLTKDVLFALNINSEKSLFDISVDIPSNYREVKVGDRLSTQIFLLQAGLQEKMDVTLNYEIKDFKGNSKLKESETIAVFKTKSFKKTFSTERLNPGTYIIAAEVIYPDGVATASSQFKVVEASPINSSFFKDNYMFIIFIVSTLAIIVLSIIIIKKYKKDVSSLKKVK